MHVLNVKDANDALPRGLAYLRDSGLARGSRNGNVLVAPAPWRRCTSGRIVALFDLIATPTRSSTCSKPCGFCGRDDVSFLITFNKRMAEVQRQRFHVPRPVRVPPAPRVRLRPDRACL